MPLPKYTIQPSRISMVTIPPMVDNELDFVSNETFCNLMHQMASVVNVASEIFNELSCDLSSLTSRLNNVEQRVSSISTAVKRLPTTEDFLSVGLQNPLVPYAARRQEDSQVLHGTTKPPCIHLYYEQAEPPPALEMMDSLRDDNKITSRLYSDPKFFFELWRQEMLDDVKGKKTPKKRRPKAKAKTTGFKGNAGHQAEPTRTDSHQNLNSDAPQQQFIYNQHHTQSPVGLPMSAMVETGAPSPKTQLPPPPPPPTSQLGGDVEDSGFYQYGDPHLVHPNEWGVIPQQSPGQPVMPMNPMFHPQYLGADQHFGVGYIPQDGGVMSRSCDSPPPPPPPPMDISMSPGRITQLPDMPPYMPSTSPPLGGTDLPPPPQSLTGSDCGILDLPVHQQEPKNGLGSPPKSSMDAAPPIPPAPPPPAPAMTPQLVTADLTKEGAPKAIAKIGPPSDLLSDIRAGFTLRKASERQLPSAPKNSSLGGHKSSLACDVAAIYEMVSRRRQAMENTSEDDDDKTSDSCGWDD